MGDSLQLKYKSSGWGTDTLVSEKEAKPLFFENIRKYQQLAIVSTLIEAYVSNELSLKLEKQQQKQKLDLFSETEKIQVPL